MSSSYIDESRATSLRQPKLHPTLRGAGLFGAIVLLGCGGSTVPVGGRPSDAASDAPTEAGDGALYYCTWKGPDGGTVYCPEDHKTSCPWSDGCDVCSCFDGQPACTTLYCGDE
jgi:hypothetical protein